MKCTNNLTIIFYDTNYLSVTSKSFRKLSTTCIGEKLRTEPCDTDVTGTVGTPPPSITYPSAALNDEGCCLKEHLYSDKITDQ